MTEGEWTPVEFTAADDIVRGTQPDSGPTLYQAGGPMQQDQHDRWQRFNAQASLAEPLDRTAPWSLLVEYIASLRDPGTEENALDARCRDLYAEDPDRFLFAAGEVITRASANAHRIRAHIEALQRELDAQIQEDANRIEFLNEQLTIIAKERREETGEKSFDVPGLGKIQTRETKAHWRKAADADEDATREFLRIHGRAEDFLVPQPDKILWRELTSAVPDILYEDEGEIVPGVELVPDSISVTLPVKNWKG